jgi:hypothetical protein
MYIYICTHHTYIYIHTYIHTYVGMIDRGARGARECCGGNGRRPPTEIAATEREPLERGAAQREPLLVCVRLLYVLSSNNVGSSASSSPPPVR